jgi:hypothetical protein
MSNKDIAFYSKNKAYKIDFKAENISSDGGIALLEKIERKHHLIKDFSKNIVDKRNQSYVQYDIYNLLKTRVFMLAQGYEDTNDVEKLKTDELFTEFFNNKLTSQSTLSRFENSVDKHQIFNILNNMLLKYVKSLKGRDKVIIDIDGTDAETYGHQQLTMFNGFYGHFMYNELFFHDGETGEIILPVLRPGNAHSNWWYVSILRRIVKAIKTEHPDIDIFIRADSGFSTPKFYDFAYQNNLKYTIGIASNDVLKNFFSKKINIVAERYVKKSIKKQFITKSFQYQAKSWQRPEKCYAKIESTGNGLNVRYFISNFENQTPREIYFDFYVKRGDASENRIKEVKNMCYSNRMSNHNFWANFFRLIISTLTYELMLLIKQKIQKTKHETAKKWQVNNIRLYLLKIGGMIKKTKRLITISLSKSAVYQDIFLDILLQ